MLFRRQGNGENDDKAEDSYNREDVSQNLDQHSRPSRTMKCLTHQNPWKCLLFRWLFWVVVDTREKQMKYEICTLCRTTQQASAARLPMVATPVMPRHSVVCFRTCNTTPTMQST